MVNIFHRKVTTQRQQFFETGKETKTKKLKGVLFAKVNETDFYQLPHIQFKNNFSPFFVCLNHVSYDLNIGVFCFAILVRPIVKYALIDKYWHTFQEKTKHFRC